MVKNKLFIKLLFCVFVFFALAALTFNAKTPSAEENVDLPSVSEIMMQNGAEVRVTSEGQYGNKTGIRFTMLINKAFYDGLENPEIGMYVALASEISAEEMKNEAAAANAKFHFIADRLVECEAGIKAREPVYMLKAVISNIATSNYNTALIANGYCDKGEGKQFADNPQTRSVAQVSSVFIAQNPDTEIQDVYDFVDGAVTDDNFNFSDSTIKTDIFKGVSFAKTLPENLTAIWSSSNVDVATVDGDGNVALGTKTGSAVITAKLGTNQRSATIYVGEPVIAEIGEDNYTQFSFNDNSTATYISYSPAESLTDFGGDYNGNAVKYKVFAGHNGQYRATNPYTAEQLNAIKTQYNTVSMFIAFDLQLQEGQATNSMYINMLPAASGTSFLSSAGITGTDFSKTYQKKWAKVSISVQQYIDGLSSDGKYFVLFRCGDKADGVNQEKSGIYIGNIVFENVVPAIAEISEYNYTQFSFNGNSTSAYISYVPGKNLTDFDGDYSGNAVKYKVFAGHNGQYRATNPYTAEQLNAIKAQYNTVSMFIAFDLQLQEGQTADSMYVNMLPATSGTSFLLSAGITGTSFSKTYQKKWAKVSISVQDYIDGLSSDGKYFVLFRCGDIPAGVDKEKSGIYIGNIVFENV